MNTTIKRILITTVWVVSIAVAKGTQPPKSNGLVSPVRGEPQQELQAHTHTQVQVPVPAVSALHVARIKGKAGMETTRKITGTRGMDMDMTPTTRYHLTQAVLRANRYCQTRETEGFPCHQPLIITIRNQSEMPQHLVAMTSRRPNPADTSDLIGSGCLLTFTPEALLEDRIVAHEVCHCTTDYEVMNISGWTGISGDEITSREAGAEACSQKLVEYESLGL